MLEADVPVAAQVSADAFEFDISPPSARARWEGRLLHSLVTDPGGSFVAEHDGVVVGVAQAVLRDRLWILSLLTVSPNPGDGREGREERRGSVRGAGRALIQATLGYGADQSDGGLIVSSNDPRALRLYASCGFLIEPTLEASGPLDAALIPEPDPRVTVVNRSELGRLAPISRAVRGAAHTPDLALAYDTGGTVFALADRGYVATTPGHAAWALAALDEQTATTLLWSALHHARDEGTQTAIRFITGDQQWAIQVLVAARLAFKSYGALCRRGQVGRLSPYIPSPSFA